MASDSHYKKNKNSASVDNKKIHKKGSTRKIAIDILLCQRQEKKPVDLFFNRLAAHLLPRDRAFVKSIVFGVLRNKEYLDIIISSFSKHPLKKMKLRTLVTLEAGVYQLLFMDRVPSSAAVNATVDTLKESRQPRWLSGFVNGMLRNISRGKEKLPAPEVAGINGNPVLNHPQWLVEKWERQLDPQTVRSICQVNNLEPTLTLRVNSRKVRREELLERLLEDGLQVWPCRYSPYGLIFSDFSGSVNDIPGFEQGLFQVQDQAAQLATMLLGPFETRNRILDACAGLGGKTSHILQEIGDRAEITVVEPDQRRFGLLQENIDRLSLSAGKIEFVGKTLEEYVTGKPACFDGILLDVPCSGTGVIRRNPDIRWNREPSDFASFQETQKKLLNICASLLLPNGQLVYATCSLEPEENEEIIYSFLDQNNGFELVDASILLPQSAGELVSKEGFFKSLPGEYIDGFFAAALRRRTNL